MMESGKGEGKIRRGRRGGEDGRGMENWNGNWNGNKIQYQTIFSSITSHVSSKSHTYIPCKHHSNIYVA